MVLFWALGFFDDVFVEVVDGHAGVEDDTLGVDAAGALAQQIYRCVGHLLGGQRLLAQGFSKPAFTELKRTFENALNDLARKQSEESRAALAGPINP